MANAPGLTSAPSHRWQRAAQLALHVSRSKRTSVKSLVRRQARSLLRRPPVIAMVVGLVVALIEPVRAAFFSKGGPLEFVGLALSSLADAGVPVINLMMAYSLGHKLRSLRRWRDLFGSAEMGISTRTLSVLTLGRMVFVPAVDGLALWALLPQLPSSRLLRVMLFIEMAPPTASIVVLLAHLANKPKLAQQCAYALVPQYLLLPVTLTITLSVALKLTQ